NYSITPSQPITSLSSSPLPLLLLLPPSLPLPFSPPLLPSPPHEFIFNNINNRDILLLAGF
ncbi:3510_t:CDS:1, partial [Funneliformis mosseae]